MDKPVAGCHDGVPLKNDDLKTSLSLRGGKKKTTLLVVALVYESVADCFRDKWTIGVTFISVSSSRIGRFSFVGGRDLIA